MIFELIEPRLLAAGDILIKRTPLSDARFEVASIRGTRVVLRRMDKYAQNGVGAIEMESAHLHRYGYVSATIAGAHPLEEEMKNGRKRGKEDWDDDE